ncbi:uncharacterized protein [Littorina saxatilis]|uniref:Uncharacterized protein n=1 Tax=Littorina saxatilis TaxID=31220 RepID=A0AAN9GAK7_9CAEN
MADNKNKTLRPSLNPFFLHSTVLFFLLFLLLPSPSHQSPTQDRQKRQASNFFMNTPLSENNISNSNDVPENEHTVNMPDLGGPDWLFNITWGPESNLSTPDVGLGCGAMIPCEHGLCNYSNKNKTKMYCVCDPGYVGDRCQNPCGRNCSNDGTCYSVKTEGNETKEVCQCPYPWVGPYCEDMPPKEVEEDNSWVYWLSGSLSVGLVVVIVAAALVIYCLWKKRLVFAMKFVYFFKSYEDNDGLLYDAFVSYVSRPADEDFVYTHLRPKLEEEMGFRLCLHQRDFVIGETISNNICDTLENTRRFILVLTPRYLESEWAEFEYQKAFHEMLKLNIRIVPIILEEITATTTINHTLKAILDSVTYITYPGSQASQQQLDKFWERVHLSMPKMKNKKTSTDQVESFKLTDVKISDCGVAAAENGKLPGLKNKDLKEMEGLESAYLKMLDAPAKNEKPAQDTATDPADLNHVRVDVASTGGPANIAIGSSVGEDSLRSAENHVVADTSEAKNAPVQSKGDRIPSLSAAAVTKTKPTGENKPGNTNTRTPRSKNGNIFTRFLAPKKENAEAVKLKAYHPIGDSSFSQLSENQPSKCLQNGVGSNGTVNKAFDDQESSVK